MPDPPPLAAQLPMRWDTLATGADLWATVVMASGFVLPAGQTVREHYRIVKTLGQGGMGQVLGVTLVGSTDQPMYALKMVAKSTGASKDPADQLEAERQAKAFAALLRGEAAKQELVQRHGVSVARLFALVRFEDGSLGLRMEIARGHSLESFLEDETKQRSDAPPDLSYCLVVMRKVLYQLRRLHELVDPSSPSGFVHSDMKPGNVFVDDGDRYDPFVTLLDFGVATAGQALDIDRSRAAGRKSLILHDAGGTFGFAPPHHFTGKPSPLSDVYAALVILYELVALQSPWDFGGIPKTAANLFKLDDAMRAGPKPVRTGRAAIPEAAATVLDAFFAEEFRALQKLADDAHSARNAPDEEVRRAMAERLRTLAHSYQEKVDALRQQLTEGATRSSDPEAVAAVPAPDGLAKARNAPTRVDVPSRQEARISEPTASTLAAHDEPVRVPMRPWFGWGSLLFVLAIAAGGSWVWLHGVPHGWLGSVNSVLGVDSGAPPIAANDAMAAPPAAAEPDAMAAVPAIVPAVVPVSPDASLAVADAMAFATDASAMAAMTVDVMAVPDTSAMALGLTETLDASEATVDASVAIEAPSAVDAGVAADDAASAARPEEPAAVPHETLPPPTAHVGTQSTTTNANSAAHAPIVRAPAHPATHVAPSHTAPSHPAAHARPPAHRPTTTNRTRRPAPAHHAPARSTHRPAHPTRRR